MRTFKLACALASVSFLLLSGCATNAGMARDDAKVLAVAGQSATQTLVEQGSQIHSSLATLPLTVGLYEILNCRGLRDTNSSDSRTECIAHAQKNAAESPAVKTWNRLSALIDKRIKAFQALNDAYAAFFDLATYDAGQEAAKSIQNAFASINTLSSSISAMGVTAPLLPISATITKVFEGAGALAADEKQHKLIFAANKDLRNATDQMIRALAAERDLKAMTSLIGELGDERNRLERSTLDAGLASPYSVLSPFYSKAAPDITLSSNPPARNMDLVAASADLILSSAQSDRQSKVADAYNQAITALSALSAEHQKFEDKKSVDVQMIMNEVKHLRDVMKSLGN